MKLAPALDDTLVRVLEPFQRGLVAIVLLVLVLARQKLLIKQTKFDDLNEK